MNKRIILVGPTCSGKTFLRKKLEDRGFKFDVSYTTREPREGEQNDMHYHFITEDDFAKAVKEGAFYEHVSYNGNQYGTGMYEWNNCPCFIMETDGIKHIKSEDRESCFIIFLNPDEHVRWRRMSEERNWDGETISNRLQTDREKFKNFADYDLLITNSNF